MTGTFFALLVCSVSISFVLLLFHNSDGITALCFSHKHRILPITPGMGKNKQLQSRTKIVGTLNANAVFSLPVLPLSLPMLFIAIQWPNRVYQHWGDEKTQKRSLRINLLKMSRKKLRKWYFWVSKFNNFLGECAPRPPYNGLPSSLQLFSPRAYTFRLSTPIRNACIRILGWWCMTCDTPELSWITGATKATTETKLRVPSANAF